MKGRDVVGPFFRGLGGIAIGVFRTWLGRRNAARLSVPFVMLHSE
ncbi:hypothetical protein PhaeoP97_01780 [Phaeobacter porticola]|uniref:Uncharacterized protein n=1 Tax=Phaeobacter porticola TaxID=1844006 RepID=A0A1L3I523_9RHOB|nr:hypothetical protein PhaeoP97_01780 [Phaeobacter porticola]